MGDYQDHYLKSDVLILAVFENFRKTSFWFWFDFCFTALQHILGHFGRGQLT